jgi:hypothetical protein
MDQGTLLAIEGVVMPENMMNSDHKAVSDRYRGGYDVIFREGGLCVECEATWDFYGVFECSEADGRVIDQPWVMVPDWCPRGG